MRQPAPASSAHASRQRAQTAALVLLGTTFLLFQLGYSFERGDQLQYLLLPYRSIYASFLPGDWFTWQTSHYHLTYAWLVRGVHAVSGELYFPMAIFGAHLVTLAGLVYGIVRLSQALGFGRGAAVIAIVIFGFLRETGPAGTSLNHGNLLPSDMALPPLLFACAAWLSRRPLATGAWLGLCGLIHANFAVLAPLVLGPLELERALRERRHAHLWKEALLFLVIASPTIFLVVQSFLVRDPDPQAVSIALFLRAPHHYDLGAMTLAEFAWPAALLLASVPAWLEKDALSPDRRRLLLALGAVLSLAFVGSGFHIVALARLFAWRLMGPLLVILALGVGYVVTTAFARRDLRLGVWAFATSALLIVLGPEARRSEDPSDGRARTRVLRTFDASLEIFAPVRSLSARARMRTPKDARFLIPPSMISFRLLARRAVFVDWKCAPMKGDEAREWYRRMLTVMDTETFPKRGFALQEEADARYLARPLSELVALARREGMTHIIASATHREQAAAGARFLFQNSGYAVFEVTQPRR